MKLIMKYMTLRAVSQTWLLILIHKELCERLHCLNLLCIPNIARVITF